MNSTDFLEKALRASLQPVDPGVDFTVALQARLAQEIPPASSDRPRALDAMDPRLALSGRARRLYAASLALAASIVVALGVGWQLQDLRAEKMAAQARVHAQLLVALEITSERLEQAQQRIEQFQTQEHNL